MLSSWECVPGWEPVLLTWKDLPDGGVSTSCLRWETACLGRTRPNYLSWRVNCPGRADTWLGEASPICWGSANCLWWTSPSYQEEALPWVPCEPCQVICPSFCISLLNLFLCHSFTLECLNSLTFGERFKEHLKDLSPVHHHSSNTGHPTTQQNFQIIGREGHGLARNIKESIFIRVNNPTLNKNIGKFNLPHVQDSLM